MPTATKPLTVSFARERETKRTWRFAEIVTDETVGERVGTLYVQKTTLAQLGNPETLTITLEG